MVQNINLISNIKLGKNRSYSSICIEGLNIYYNKSLYDHIYWSATENNINLDRNYFVEHADLFILGDRDSDGDNDIPIYDIEDEQLKEGLIEKIKLVLLNDDINNEILIHQNVILESIPSIQFSYDELNMIYAINIFGIKIYYKNRLYTDIFWHCNREEFELSKLLDSINLFILREYYNQNDDNSMILVGEIEDNELKNNITDSLRATILDYSL